MRKQFKSLALLLVVFMLVQTIFVGVFSVSVSAAVSQPSANWGIRDQVATSISSDGLAYYTGDYVFDELSTETSGTIESMLRTLMRSTHTNLSSYDNCRDYAKYTDCEGGNSTNLTTLYSDQSIAAEPWNSGNRWNREHVWPKSLGGDSESGGGADLHHIRPAEYNINSTRGNKLYGNVSGGSTTNGGTVSGQPGGTYAGNYFEPNDNVKGDVARIVLYVYVRWYDQWGATSVTKVFQSVDVLLEWCEMDPVDTWEMGRNDVVEDVQGNRNVFIDYPEYAWLIFGKDVPTDMQTPSKKASGGVSGNPGGDSTGGGSTGGDSTGGGTTANLVDGDVVEALYALGSDESLEGTFQITGKVIALDTYNNPTIEVEGYASQPVFCYKLVDSRLTIGTVCTISATTIMRYGSSTYELKNCSVVSVETGTGTVEPTIPGTVTKTHLQIADLAGVTAGQNVGIITNKQIKLDNNITIIAGQGNAATEPCIYSDAIRMYQNGNTLTVKSVNGAAIKTVKLTLANIDAGKGPISVTGGTASELSSDNVYTITANEGATEIVIKTLGTTNTERVYVAKIEVVYDADAVSGGDSGNTGGDSGNTGGDSGNTGGDSGNTGGDSGNTGGDSGNTGGDSGNTGGDSGNTGGDSGNTGGDSGNTGGDSGNTGGDSGNTGGDNTNPGGGDHGGGAGNQGSSSGGNGDPNEGDNNEDNTTVGADDGADDEADGTTAADGTTDADGATDAIASCSSSLGGIGVMAIAIIIPFMFFRKKDDEE